MNTHNVISKRINFLFSALAIVIITIITVTTGITYKTSVGLEISEDKATTNPAWDPSSMQITPEQILAKVVEYTNNTSRTYGGGCIGFVEEVIKGVQPNCRLHGSLFGGTDNALAWENDSTINGISASKANYAHTNANAGGSPWWTVLGMDATTLQPGDIIIGDLHAMIYLGQASSYAELSQRLGLTGLTNWSNPTGQQQPSTSYYKQYTNGSTYWTADVNGNGHVVRIENYDWSDTASTAGSKNLNNMRVYRFKKKEGKYSVYVAKKDKNNQSGNSLVDTGFSVYRRLNGGIEEYAFHGKGSANRGWNDVAENVYYTDSTDKDCIASNINITNTDVDDVYRIREVEAPNGYKATKGGTGGWVLGFNVKKGTVGDGYGIIEVKVKAGNTVIATLNSSNTSAMIGGNSAATTDSSDCIVKFEYTASSVIVTWNDERLEGNYHLNVLKKSANNYATVTNENNANITGTTDALGGATFRLTQQIRNDSGLAAQVTQTVTTTEGNAAQNVFGNTTIYLGGLGVGKHDVYTIEETTVPTGYLPANLDGVTINVYKKSNGSAYVVDYVRVNDGHGTNLGDTQGKTKKMIDTNGDGVWDLGIEVSADGTTISVVVINEKDTGTFNIQLVKYLKDTTQKLAGAKFNVKVQKVENGTVVENPIYNRTLTTGTNGMLNASGISIDAENEELKITLTETEAPAGYIAIDGPITFNVTTKLEDGEFKLVEAGVITVANAKKVEVKAGEILIEAENRTTSVEIHKGVKKVQNQDSGYYFIDTKIYALDEENEYTDDTTGKTYTEIELKDVIHDWVVETTIPEGILGYKKYVVTDPIDISKLSFEGLSTVVVEKLNVAGEVEKELILGTDYTVAYNEDATNKKGNLAITFINKKDGNNFAGAFLSAAGVENTKIRITFNTTFRINEDGKLAILDGITTNADNKAKITYDNGNGTEQDKFSENPEVHTGAVSVFKYEDTNGNDRHDEGEKALVGAEFKIAETEEDAKNGKFIRISGNELVAVTNEHGIATFVGLSFGGDAINNAGNLNNGLYNYDWTKASKDYYLVETSTPDGYEKLKDVIKVTVSKDSTQIIDLTDKINEMECVGNRPLIFDLSLRKWVTEAIVIEDGKTVVHKTNHKAEDEPEGVVKVDLKKSKLKNVTVKFKYSIRVKNDGEIAGEAQEITDYIPEGLKFDPKDNPDWTTTDDERIVKTDKLKGVTLEHGETAEVEIVLTWINSEKTMGVQTNTAEISKDYNKYGRHDIDSTPNNKKKGEDDIDIAEVMLTIKTGSEAIAYASIAVGFIAIISIGIVIIKRKFAEI